MAVMPLSPIQARSPLSTRVASTVSHVAQRTTVLATLVESGDRAWIGLSGMTAIEVRRAPSAG